LVFGAYIVLLMLENGLLGRLGSVTMGIFGKMETSATIIATLEGSDPSHSGQMFLLHYFTESVYEFIWFSFLAFI